MRVFDVSPLAEEDNVKKRIKMKIYLYILVILVE